jgi:hypothetical protein
METLIPVVGFALAGFGFAYLAQRFWPTERNRLRRLLMKHPRTLIGEVRDGKAVRLVGRLRLSLPPLSAPVTGKSCAYYFLRILEVDRESVREIERLDNRLDFTIEDGSGRALVRVDNARFVARIAETDRSERLDVLERFRLSRRGQLILQESLVCPDDEVTVVGTARWEIDPKLEAESYREAPRRLVLEATAARPMHITNDPELTR